LPKESRIRVLHYGKAHNEEWAGYAEQEMKINPRYTWFGEVPHENVRQAYSCCHLMVLPSVMEGGANVISEASVAGLPVIASEIDGSVGLLGKGYKGFYPVKDEVVLRNLLIKAETDSGFIDELTQQCSERAKLFTIDAEKLAWKELISCL
jgi:glycosyltransferase involved in cell wall biosynthesis